MQRERSIVRAENYDEKGCHYILVSAFTRQKTIRGLEMNFNSTGLLYLKRVAYDDGLRFDLIHDD